MSDPSHRVTDTTSRDSWIRNTASEAAQGAILISKNNEVERLQVRLRHSEADCVALLTRRNNEVTQARLQVLELQQMRFKVEKLEHELAVKDRETADMSAAKIEAERERTRHKQTASQLLS
jgi:hypothetical protein